MSMLLALPRRRIVTTYSPLTVFGSDLALWLDGQDTATLFTDSTEATPTANAASVGRWKDKSGNGKHADQATGSAKPTRSDTAINGHCGLTFDGGDDLVTAAINLSSINKAEIWVVCARSFSQDSGIAGVGNAGATGWFDIETTTGGRWAAYSQGNTGISGAWSVTGGTTTSAALIRGTLDWSLSSHEMECGHDGGTTSSYPFDVNNTTNLSSLAFYVGSRAGTLKFTGPIGEIWLLKRQATAPEAAAALVNFQTKWGTP